MNKENKQPGKEGEQELELRIQEGLKHLQHPPLDSSVKYFLETGVVNGNFLLAVKSLFNIPAEVERLSGELLKASMALVRSGYEHAANEIYDYCINNKVTEQFTDMLRGMLNEDHKKSFVYSIFEEELKAIELPAGGEEKRFTLKEMIDCYNAGYDRAWWINDAMQRQGTDSPPTAKQYFKEKFNIDL